MACIFIDYENETGRMLEGISLLRLTKNDEIIFFYSRKRARITIELHREFEKLKAKKTYIEAESDTSNALDFQLVTYLGSYINQNPETKYFIISKDRGYDCVCSFWAKKGVFVRRIEEFSYYMNHKK